MKKLLFGSAIALAGFTMPAASAQNFCAPCPCDPCGCSDFSGLYLGGNIGVFSHVAHRNDLDGFFVDNSGWSTIDTSFTAGLQLGYDLQCCSKLIGVVVDWNWVDTHRSIFGVSSDTEETSIISLRNEARWFTTIRARAGLTVGDALFYVTGGAAVTRIENRWNNGTFEFRDRHHRWGWTAGAGTEFLIGCGFSLGAEVLYLHFDHHERSFTTAVGTIFSFGHSDSFWLARVLLNYRFGNLGSFFVR